MINGEPIAVIRSLTPVPVMNNCVDVVIALLDVGDIPLVFSGILESYRDGDLAVVRIGINIIVQVNGQFILIRVGRIPGDGNGEFVKLIDGHLN